MKYIIVAALLLPSAAFAQTTEWYYGSTGEPLGHSTQTGNQTFYYGPTGQPLGRRQTVTMPQMRTPQTGYVGSGLPYSGE